MAVSLTLLPALSSERASIWRKSFNQQCGLFRVFQRTDLTKSALLG
jgi:hypothetical protein